MTIHRGCFRIGIVLWVVACIALPSRATGAAPNGVRRIAVLIGANDPPPGRAPLRYAHDDASRMGDVLARVGGFARADVHVLLDPSRADIEQILAATAAIARGAAGDIVFVFYYSGHSDGQFVYPRGSPISLGDLRSRIGVVGARVLLGILDTCRGGNWTQAKGLTVGPALEAVDLVPLSSEGTALLSSSSGLESAHEAEAIGGSFFTHHLVGGLLGAADGNGDGLVTLEEAFEYAKDHTVRDSARMATTIQHPSFDMQLRGRQNLVLAQLANSSSSIEIAQSHGPLEVIQLGSGITVSELGPGARQVRLALPAGRYLVRKVADGKTYAKEIAIGSSSSASLAEEQLEVTTDRLAIKGGEAPPVSAATTLPGGWWELRFGVGVSAGPASEWGKTVRETQPTIVDDGTLERKFTGVGALTLGLTDRLSWTIPAPAFAYRLGSPDSFEIVPRLGLTGFGFPSRVGFLGFLDVGVAFRLPTSFDQSFFVTTTADSQFSVHTASSQDPGQAPTLWRLGAGIGYAWRIQNVVSLAIGSAIESDVLFDPQDSAARRSPSALSIGSVQSLGYRPLPLVQVHLSSRFSLDAYATWTVILKSGAVRDAYLAGFTWNF